MNTIQRTATIAALVLVAGCATTRVIDSWKEPSVSSLHFKKVLVIGMMRDDSMRRTGEDQICANIKKAQAVPSYTLLNLDELQNLEAVKAKIKDNGFDGVVTMRLVSKDKETTYVPGSYPTTYYSFGGYYGYSAAYAYDPGYIQTDTILRIETNVYSVGDDKLVWSGLSETVNPEGTKQLVSEVGAAVRQEMQKQGLLPK